MNVEVYQDEGGGWRWRLLGENGEVVAVGESYTRERDAIRGWETARRIMADAEVPAGAYYTPEQMVEFALALLTDVGVPRDSVYSRHDIEKRLDQYGRGVWPK
jgi:uncharacterized protein YegP (UPF0339 family)